MKKSFPLILLFSIIFTLVGCGSNGNNSNNSDNSIWVYLIIWPVGLFSPFESTFMVSADIKESELKLKDAAITVNENQIPWNEEAGSYIKNIGSLQAETDITISVSPSESVISLIYKYIWRAL